MSSKPQPQTAVATTRTPGFDVARALAVLGMVVVNYEAKLGASERGPAWLVWMTDRLGGRAAALFVLLAGVGISLRSRKARTGEGGSMSFERRALLKRAFVLFIVGLLNLHMWDWDILHFYGLYLLLAVLVLGSRAAVLWIVALAFVVGAAVLQLRFDYHYEVDFWTPIGMALDLGFNGLHPVFPWMAFLLVGMWLGRLDLRDRAVRNRVLALALAVAAAGELLDAFSLSIAAALGLAEGPAQLLNSWPRPPTPAYVLAAGGAAVAMVCLAISVTQPRAEARWVIALVATGQMAFSLYIAHAVAIVVPQQHGLLDEAPLVVSMVYAFAFYAVAVVSSVWWRRRFAQGPLEALIRQITGRTESAPWGGALIR
jgi:uncharacterized membrane protein YeiB